jgi:hypothetical protein
MTDLEIRIGHCNNGANQQVCTECKDKYSVRSTKGKIFNVRMGECYICRKKTVVGNSMELFGLRSSNAL